MVEVSIASVARRKLSTCRSSAGHPHPNCTGRQRAVLPDLQIKSTSPSRSKSWHRREVSGRNLYLSRLRTTGRVHVCQDWESKVLQFVESLLSRFCFVFLCVLGMLERILDLRVDGHFGGSSGMAFCNGHEVQRLTRSQSLPYRRDVQAI